MVRVAAALAAGFVLLAAVVAVTGGVPGDDAVLRLTSSADALDAAARVVDRWTGYAAVGAACALLAALLLATGRRRDAALVAVAVAGAVLGTTAAKAVVARPRPELASPLVEVSQHSFPSGHAAATAALAAAAVLAAGGRASVWVAGAVLVVVTAAAQLVLALHHPSDLVAGWLWAGAWTAATWAVARRRERT